MVYSPKPRSDVFCFKLNFNLSKLGLLVVGFSASVMFGQSDYFGFG